MKFEHICKLAAARRCYASGQSVKDIAKSAGVTTATVYRWLRATRSYWSPGI